MTKPPYMPKSPREIHFTRKQTRWIINSLPDLRTGYWPVDPEDIGRKVISRNAPFITAAECAAEVEERMEQCGIDGLILLAIECWGETDTALSKYLNIPIWSIKKRYKRALGYVASGPARRWHDTSRRKGETYEQFKSRPKKGKRDDLSR